MQKLNLKIQGMGCGACVKKVSQALKNVPGVQVENVEVGKATISCEAGSETEAVVNALAQAGYAAHVVQSQQQ